MQSNSRQLLSFVAILMMVVSAFAFIPSAKGEASLNTSLEGYYNEYSFASVNGSAEYDVTLTNDGDVDFDTVSLTASFQDETWLTQNVTFSTASESNNETFSLSLASGALSQVHVSVLVGNGAKIDFAEVPEIISMSGNSYTPSGFAKEQFESRSC